MGERTSPVEVVEAFGELWARHDLDGALAMLTDDGVFEATGPAPDGVRHVGREAIGAAWTAIFDDPDSHFEVEATYPSGDHVVQLWTYRWADGHVRGVDVFRVEGDRIAEKLAYVKG